MATVVLLPLSALSITESVGETSTAAERFPRKWIARLFYETLVDFAVAEGLGSSVCQMHTQMYRKHLANDTNWAVQSEYTTIGIALWKRFFYDLKSSELVTLMSMKNHRLCLIDLYRWYD